MNLYKCLLTFLVYCFAFPDEAIAGEWQQRVEYSMHIDFDVNTHRFSGVQSILYTNNSPDTLHKVFYHLYLNAFQPGSAMDIRSRTILDPSVKILDRIVHLGKDDMGYQTVSTLNQDSKPVEFRVEGTILEVVLNRPILPGSNTTLDMEFKAQVPLQIRRNGRGSEEGIDYSMAQWYPKICEFDEQGWHANPYVAREFYGVWGDFDVKIAIDSRYVLGGSGILQNAVQMGYGTDERKMKNHLNGKEMTTWHFIAENVHDFVWAADRDYKVISHKTSSGTLLYFLYQPGDQTSRNWEELPQIMDRAQEFMNANYGKYPYPVYSFIQGGDGGMEYPMATLITGERTWSSLVGVAIHEWMHSWYQMVLGTNESLFAWMDEGFTSFATTEIKNHLRKISVLKDQPYVEKPFNSTFETYREYLLSGLAEPMSTHADHFETNTAYSRSAYTQGAVYLKQLEYIVGPEHFRAALLRYFNTYKFKHPDDNDMIRIFEKVSGLELDWYNEYMKNMVAKLDYGVHSVNQDEDRNFSIIYLVKHERMPMPIDIRVSFSDGSQQNFYIPLAVMRGEKPNNNNYTLSADWSWTHPFYALEFNAGGLEIIQVEIDPEYGMADLNLYNNLWKKSRSNP